MWVFLWAEGADPKVVGMSNETPDTPAVSGAVAPVATETGDGNPAGPPTERASSSPGYGLKTLAGALTLGVALGAAVTLGAVTLAGNSTPTAGTAASSASDTTGATSGQETQTGPGVPDIPVPAGAAGWGEPIVWGDPAAEAAGAPSIAIVEDLTCPFCGALHSGTEEMVAAAVEGGRAVVKRYLVGFFGPGSITAAEAAACAADQGALEPFLTAVYKDQAPEHAGLTTEGAVAVAAGPDVNIADQTAFETCVTDRTYQAYIESINQVAQQAGVAGTPAVFVNQEQLPPTVNPTDPRVFEAILNGTSVTDLAPKPLG